MSPSSIIVLVLFLIFGLAILIPYIFDIQNTLKAMAPHNRKVMPQRVWLLLVPIVSIVWRFALASRLSESIELELRERNIPVKRKPIYILGMVYSTIGLATGLLNLLKAFMPGVTIVYCTVGLINLVVFILYWIKVSEFKNLLHMSADERAIWQADKLGGL
jgi:uncharacterized membrane protein YqjE